MQKNCKVAAGCGSYDKLSDLKTHIKPIKPQKPAVLGHFGHGHFGLGRFGLVVFATDVSATENAEGGRFGHNHKFWVWDVCMHVMHFMIV